MMHQKVKHVVVALPTTYSSRFATTTVNNTTIVILIITIIVSNNDYRTTETSKRAIQREIQECSPSKVRGCKLSAFGKIWRNLPEGIQVFSRHTRRLCQSIAIFIPQVQSCQQR
jgi:hypothetical protein